MDEVNRLFTDKDADVLYLSIGAPRPASCTILPPSKRIVPSL
ncbi:MAG: hypothetical protein ABI780_06770 [Ardenticatenales bacterium]